jgi:hypothetical protein
MKNSIWSKRIPSILGILLITVGIIATSFLIQKGIIFITKAAPSNAPKDVRVTNVTDSSFTVSYKTDDKFIGSINLGTNPSLGQISRDDRDQQSGSLGTFKLHNITVRNLKPTTKYYFSIISGQDTFLNNDQPYEIDTSSLISTEPSRQEPISGKILYANGQNASEAIIYATIDNAQPISTLIKSDGSYILPLNSLRTSDLSSYFQFANNLIKMQAIGPDSQISNVILSIKQIFPVPPITLEKNYDFSQGADPISSSSAQFQQFPSFSADIQSKKKIELRITIPEDDETFSDLQPTFRGIALPIETVKIEIPSASIKDDVTTDIYGNWKYRPKQPLGTSEHTIVVTTKNSYGVMQALSRDFIIFPLGSQVSESATPSATPTPRPTATPTIVPTVIPTATVTPSPTAVPTAVPTKVPTGTVVPTITPTTALPTATPTIAQKLPTPTISSPGDPSGITIGIFGIGITLLGGFLFFLTRGSISSL